MSFFPLTIQLSFAWQNLWLAHQSDIVIDHITNSIMPSHQLCLCVCVCVCVCVSEWLREREREKREKREKDILIVICEQQTVSKQGSIQSTRREWRRKGWQKK